MREQLRSLHEAKEWIDFKERIYDVHMAIFKVTKNRLLIQIFDNIVADRRAVDYDGGAQVHSPVSQQHLVYAALGDRMREEIRALSMTTLTLEQWAAARPPTESFTTISARHARDAAFAAASGAARADRSARCTPSPSGRR